ncbi:MAG TPA: helix-turn-helix domain-containing protein [Ktedonobacteraceae bacterium]|jgi:DNA-binding MarR family transcriptional regulator
MRPAFPLADRQLALLACLLRAPFLQARDLARELALGQSTVYRWLRALQARGLLEALARPVGEAHRGVSRLYVLSPAGQYLVGEALAKGELPAGHWEISERFLRTLLPRLDRLVCGQGVLHALLASAPRFFGRRDRPALVRSSWIRDYERVVSGKRTPGFSAPARVFADWLLVLRVQAAGEQQERCYSLFVLLDAACFSAQLIAQRLQGLLQLRQVLAREQVLASEYFPPVLVLLPDWQRAWRWQQAAGTGHTSLLPLRGALTVWNATAAGAYPGQDLWRLPWRALSPAGSVPLRSLLTPVSAQRLPAEWLAAGHHQRTAGRVHKQSRARRRGAACTPGAFSWNLARRAGLIDPASTSSRTLGLSGLSLGLAHYHLLELLLAAPLLSQADLQTFLALPEGAVQRLLATVQEPGCLADEVLPGEQQPRYSLALQGQRLLALRHHLLPASAIFKAGPESPGLAWLQEKTHALRLRADLVLAVYAFFTRLIQQAAQRSGQRLLWWELGEACMFSSAGSQRLPHAMGEYQAHRRLRFWLDWQERWSHESSLRQTLAGYAATLCAPQWQEGGSLLLLMVCPDSMREHQLWRLLCALSPGLRVCATTRELLLNRGPLAPIWQVAGRGSGRHDWSTPALPGEEREV